MTESVQAKDAGSNPGPTGPSLHLDQFPHLKTVWMGLGDSEALSRSLKF